MFFRTHHFSRAVQRGVALVCVASGGLSLQAALPVPPDGFFWDSQGVQVYQDEASFTTDLSRVFAVSATGTVGLSEQLSLQAFDATADSLTAFMVYSSSYSVSLRGIGSALILNLDGSEQTYAGSVSFSNWDIGGMASANAQSTQLSTAGFAVPAMTAQRLSDGGVDSLGLNLSDTGAAPSSGGTLNFDFTGSFDVALTGGTPTTQIFANGSAFGTAAVQTVYERFVLTELSPIPEPSTPLCLVGAAIGWSFRRRR